MTYHRTTNFKDIQTTSLIGYVHATFDHLVALFGEPTRYPDHASDKIDAEWWVVDDETGLPITVYNYKDGQNYAGPSAPPVEQITQWNIGGRRHSEVLAAKIFGDDFMGLVY